MRLCGKTLAGSVLWHFLADSVQLEFVQPEDLSGGRAWWPPLMASD